MKLPEFLRVGLQNLVELSDEHFNTFISELATIPRVLDSRDIASHIAGKVPTFNYRKAYDVIQFALFLLNAADETGDIDTGFFDDIAKDNELDPAEIQKFLDRAPKIASEQHFYEWSKAVDLIQEQERVLRAARIMTDLRPVFDLGATKPPESFVLFHTLKLIYSEDRTTKEFYLALDSTDLELLHDDISRALQKKEHLEALMKAKDIGHYGTETIQD